MGWPKDPIKLVAAKKRMSDSHKGQIAWNKGIEGSTPGWPKGKPRPIESRRKMAASQKGNQNALGHVVSEEARKAISYANKGNQTQLGRKHTEEARQKMSKANIGRAVWNKGRPWSEDTREKLSKSHIGQEPWNKGKSDVYSEYTLLVMSEAKRGNKSPGWKGGISFEPYCEKFNEALKESVRIKFNRTCYLCPTTESETTKKLSIHHNDYNKMQGCGKRPWNLIPLCAKCHPKTNHNRWYWFSLLYNYWALNPEINF